MNLVEETRQLVQDNELPVKKLCSDIGVSERWYYRFRNGEYDDPGHNRMTKLRAWIEDYLAQVAA